MTRRALLLPIAIALALTPGVAARAGPPSPFQQNPLGPVTDVTKDWQHYQPASAFCVKPDVNQYASGGVGIMKFRVPDIDQFFDVNQNDFAMDAGAGVLLWLGDRFGVRGDVRYFRDLKTRTNDPLNVDFGKFHYWRGAVGATLRF